MNHILPPEYKGVILNKIPEDYPLFNQDMIAKRGYIAINTSTYGSGDENTKGKGNKTRMPTKGKKEEWDKKR